MSVGDTYRLELDGAPEGPAADPPSEGSSSIGVIGGGGVSGGDGDVKGLPRRGDDSIGAELDSTLRGRRERWERRERDDAAAGDPTVLGAGETSPPACNKMLPRSLPYAGGGASVPTLGARPHFFTLASIKTKPIWPKLTCTWHGPFAPTVGKKFCAFRPCATSSSFLPLRVKNTVPVRGRYPTPITSP